MMFSSVEIIEINSGSTQVVLQTDMHVEAPNWTPDGAALIVNGGGQLYRVPLAAPDLHSINTAPLSKLNNDHGLSPDGKKLAISDSTEHDASCIYVLPAEGGTAHRCTAHVPSWWHGWSPDGQTLVYTCCRDGLFGIASCPAGGGQETRLIGGPFHFDGPDYTPDGNWIWFNTDLGGDMALWRMKADGTSPERMTFDDGVDWFPHPSPDGRHVCFLTYPKGTEGHPFGRQVELRLMPASGGKPKTLLRLFGGQGTLNVPSWSPDSRRFAYVRYFENP